MNEEKKMTSRQIMIKKKLIGRKGNDGLLFKLVLYVLLIGISFIFLYPLLSMLSMSFMSLEDLIDSSIAWIPRTLTGENYAIGFNQLNFVMALWTSIKIAFLPTLASLVSSALIGYGLAKYHFPGKRIVLGLMLVLFLVPTVLTYIPTTVMYQSLTIFGIPLNLMGSLRAFIIPAMAGFGIRQTVFILIFYQFFRIIPQELFEAAEVDGSGVIRTFLSIAIPLAMPAFLICGLFAFVWYWNETSLARAYFGNNYTSLLMGLEGYINTYRSLYSQGQLTMESASSIYNLGVQYAMTLMSIIPLLIIYLVVQKGFVAGIDKSGIAGQ